MHVTPASVIQTRQKDKNQWQKSNCNGFLAKFSILRECLQGQWASQGVKQHIVITTWIFFLSLWSEIYLESVHSFNIVYFLFVVRQIVQSAPLDTLGVPMSPCKAVPRADEVPVTTQTSSWSFWQLSMHPRFSALGELCPHPCFHLLSHAWC